MLLTLPGASKLSLKSASRKEEDGGRRIQISPLYLVNVEPCGLFLSFLKNIFNWYAYELLSVIT